MDYFPTEASLICAKYVLCGAKICNVDWTVGEHICTYDPVERLDRRSADNTLDFLANLARK